MALAVTGAILWIVAHPYAGIYQDANLYLLMALNWLTPEAYAKDPWFLFGSQDAYSLFSPLYGLIIDAMGADDAARSIVVWGALLWLAASWLASRSLLSDTLPRAVAFLCCAVFSFNISPAGSTFLLNEGFATARVLAIPLAVTAVVVDQNRLVIAPWVLALCSVALHPLFGIWGLLCLIALRLPDRWLLGAVVCGLMLPLLTLLDPSLSALRALSAERLMFLQEATRDLLVLGGGELRMNALLFWLAALLIGARWGAERFRRTYAVIALLAVSGYLLSALVSNYLPMTVLVQAQPWRAAWLAAYFSVFALVDVGWRIGRMSDDGWCHLVLGVASLILCREIAGFLLIAAWIGLVTFPHCVRRLASSIPYVRALAILATLLAVPGFVADVRLEGEALSHFGWTAEHTLRGIVGGGGLGLGPILLAGLLIMLVRSLLLIAPLLIVSLIWSALHWDTRDVAVRHWEAAFDAGRTSVFQGIRRGDTVYWPGHVQDVWFRLGTSAYVGEYHLSGLVFSEQRIALVGQRWRRAAISSIVDTPPQSWMDEQRALDEFQKRNPSRGYAYDHPGDYVTKDMGVAGVVYLCRDPALDWVIAASPEISGLRGETTALRMAGVAGLYAYSCRLFGV